MGSPAEEKQKLIEMMNQTLANIDKRRRELNANLDAEQDENQAAEIKKELSKLENQSTAVKGARDEFEQQYAKLKTDEERKQLEHIIKMAIIVGITNESIRVAWEKQKQIEADKEAARMEREALRKERYQKAIDRLFETMTLKYVTRDMIDEIKNNKKFKEMAESDPDRLNREEMAKKDEYYAMMAEKFHRNSIKMTGDFKKDEELMRKLYEKKNGFETTSPKLKKFLEGDLEKYGTEEDKKFFQTLFKDILEVGAITRKLNNEFVSGESDFLKGNGFTKEIYDKEQSIKKRISDYKDKIMTEVLKLGTKNEQEKIKQRMAIYNAAVTVEGDIKPTVDEDAKQYHTNEFRKETEMWKVYQNLPEGTPVKHVTAKANNEMRAWTKLQRMSKMSMVEGKGSLTSNLLDWSGEKAHNILESVVNKKQLSPKDKADIKENFAALILNQLVLGEQKNNTEEKPFTKLTTPINKKKAELDRLAKQLAETPEFEKLYNQYMKGGKFKEKCIGFLAEDAEKQIAKSIAKKPAEIVKALSQRTGRLDRSRSVAIPKGKGINK